MKILVLSDTHKEISRVIELLNIHHDFDRIIHLGDNTEDAEDLEAITNLPMDAVLGNCDWSSRRFPNEKILEFYGIKMMLVHGHLFQVKSGLEQLKSSSRLRGVDIVLFGHTHRPVIEYDGKVIFFNPGSSSQPRGKKPSYGIIDINEQGDVHAEIAYFQGF